MSKKTTKRALAMSFVSVFLCVCMLVGTTFAWFTDSVTSGVNKIESGNLDITLLHSYFKDAPVIGFDFNADTATEVDKNTQLFLNVDGGKILWEPGAAAGEVFRVRNDGTLALKYELTVNGLNATATAAGKTLNDVLIVDCIEMLHNDSGTPYTPAGGVYDMGVVFNGEYKISGTLLPGEYRDFAVELEWEPTDNDNDYNIDGGLKLDLGVMLVATQLTYEKDSYDDQYDVDAEYPIIVSSSADLNSAITSGKPVTLGGDVQYSSAINNDATINLNGNTFEPTTTLKLGNNADLTMTGGDYEVNGTYGHVDVRPTTAEGSKVVFENVDFSYNKKGPTYGPSTNRLGSVVEVCAEVADAKSVVVFKNCTFDNAQVLIEGMTGKTGVVDVTFENCTFNALTSSAPIYVQNYVKGTITVKNCTFNLQCTSSTASAISVNSSTSTVVTVNAENNTINAVAATPTDSSVTGVDVVKVNGTPANIKFISYLGTVSTMNETGTVKTGIAG